MGRNKERYIPAGYVPLAIGNPADVVVYTNNGVDGKFSAICFAGKAVNATWYYLFKNEEAMLAQVAKTVNNRITRAAEVAKYKAERLAPTDIKEGDILYCSWGYDQTNVDFYKVKQVLGKNRVKIVAMNSQIVSQSLATDYVAPNVEIGGEMLKVVNGKQNSVRITSYANAYLWDGQPMYETQAGYGH